MAIILSKPVVFVNNLNVLHFSTLILFTKNIVFRKVSVLKNLPFKVQNVLLM